MKKYFILFMAVMALVFFFKRSPLWAEEKKSEFSFEFKFRSLDSYIGYFGYKTGISVGSVSVNEATLGLPKGFYVYFWNLLGTNGSKSNEIDTYLGWSGKFLGLKFDLNVGYLDSQDLFSSSGSQTDYWDAGVEISKEFLPAEGHKILPYVKVDYFRPAKNNGVEKDGFPVALGLRYEWQVGKVFSFPLVVKSEGRILKDPGLFGGESVWLGRLNTQAIWQIAKNFSVILPFIDCSSPFTDVKSKDGREFSTVVGVGIVLPF